MNETPEWYENLKNKANQQHSPIEDIMKKDAYYVLYSNPEKDFDELNTDAVPALRNKNLTKYRKSRATR